MTAEYKAKYPDNVWQKLKKPEDHPEYGYRGFHPNTSTLLPRGHVKDSGYQAFRLDVMWDQDLAITMRDGVKIYTDVFRPKDGPKLPAILTWSPYGKVGAESGTFTYDNMGPCRMGIPYGELSGYEKFEGPNPADWCERGYVVVDCNARGVEKSDGNIVWFGDQEAQDIYDTISWIAEQEWCDGNVVMMGNSWLAICQINHASRYQHPALKAIAPWEAMDDFYKDQIARGGRKTPPGIGEAIVAGFAGQNEVENPYKMLEKRPLYDDFWEAKLCVDASKIVVPMYLTASYSSGLHSAGSFRSFAAGRKGQTWLRVHTTQEWHDLYRVDMLDDLQKFYDFYTKGSKNGWDNTPPLRLSLIGFSESITRTIEHRPEPNETSYPLSRTRNQKFYLNAKEMSLATSLPSTQSSTSFNSHSFTDKVSFSMNFSKYTELSGWPWLKLYISAEETNDLDICIQLRKISINGDALVHPNYPAPVRLRDLKSTNVSKYLGPTGVLRASHRVSMLPKKHEDDYPEYSHRKAEPIEPVGKIVEVQIPIWPVGMVFGEGEGVAVEVAGHDLQLPEVIPEGMPPPKEPMDGNKGKWTVYTGGEYTSSLMLPFIEG